MKAVVAAIALFSALNLCPAGANDFVEDRKALHAFLKDHPLGEGPNYYLSIVNAFGEIDPIGLVFGSTSDAKFCNQLAALYEGRYPNIDVVCIRSDTFNFPN